MAHSAQRLLRCNLCWYRVARVAVVECSSALLHSVHRSQRRMLCICGGVFLEQHWIK
ncbi:Protein of unknown function [Pyronema omphalodes CBS 100304]|uniref:Uncharacterized protein n=1 Tax=Pyronema omphalodes (strain CBS 100304) TaxID=1076935 RepID=U4KW33_PYROM|nr:Protein of unknown function [Pyronema omphalodes CBS 100304]